MGNGLNSVSVYSVGAYSAYLGFFHSSDEIIPGPFVRERQKVKNNKKSKNFAHQFINI